MPRRSILSAAERASLLLPPDTEDELIRHYAFGETDLSLIRQRRGDANRLGVAVQLCLLRFPGQGLLVVQKLSTYRNVRNAQSLFIENSIDQTCMTGYKIGPSGSIASTVILNGTQR